MEYDYFEYTADDINSQSLVPLDETEFLIRCYVNDYNEGIYFDLFNNDGVELAIGQRLIYGEAMWNCIVDPRLPKTDLIPLDPDGKENEVNATNFPSIVHLYIANTEVDDDSTDNDNTDATDNDNSDYGLDGTVGDD